LIAVNAFTAVTTRISVSSSGTQANAQCDFYNPSISADGRYVAFWSGATTLISGDTNGKADIFVHDLQTGAKTRASVSSTGAQANGESGYSSISADGRFVAFTSEATNLVTGDTNGMTDVFVRDRQAGITTRVSVAGDGTQGNAESGINGIAISADGRYVSFTSYASNLVPDDTNTEADVFVHDLLTGATTRVSVSSDGTQSNYENGWSGSAISADGRYVVFSTYANNLVPGDTNGTDDVFIHDLQTGATTLVSVSSDGTQGNSSSDSGLAISADGRYVMFDSYASNLVPNDTNNVTDVFVHDQQTGATTRVSVNSDGTQGTRSSGYYNAISADGRYVVFGSGNRWSPADTNGFTDIYLHDRLTGTTRLVSLGYDGTSANQGTEELSISRDGRYVAYTSLAYNLVPGDTNSYSDVFVCDLSNNPPIPVNDEFTTAEDIPLSVATPGVLGNDTDRDNDILTAILVAGPSHGTLTLNANGAFTYTPAANYHGSDSFIYRANDGTVDSNVAIVNLTVASVNDPPVVQNDAYDIYQGVPLSVPAPGVLGNDGDPDGDVQQILLTDQPAHGTVTLHADGSFIYIPDMDNTDPDAFGYKVSDGVAYSSVAMVTITIHPLARVVRAVSQTAASDATATVPIVLEAEGNENAIGTTIGFDPALLSNPVVTLGTDAGSAQLLLNTTQVANGRLGIMLALPAGQVFPAGTRELVRVTFATSDIYPEETTKIAFYDAPITREAVDMAANQLPCRWEDGTVTIELDGYEADVAPRTDGNGDVSAADWVQVGLIASGIPLDPLFPDSTLELVRADCAPRTTLGDGRVTTADWVQAGRYAVGLDPLTHTGGPAEPAPQGTALAMTVRDSTLRTVRLVDATIARGAQGTVAVQLDAMGDENALGFSISFDPTKLQYESSQLGPDGTGLSLIANTDGAGDGAIDFLLGKPMLEAFTAGTHNVLLITFTAIDPGSAGLAVPLTLTDSPLTREVVDVTAGVLPANWVNGTVTIPRVNHAPVADDRQYSTDEDTPVAITLTGSDDDGDPLTFAVAGHPAHGTLAGIVPAVTYRPATNYHGPDSFTFTVNDGTTDSAPATVSMTITSVNDRPLAIPQTITTAEDTAKAITLAGSDVDGDTLSFTIVTPPAHGTLTGTAPALTYTPTANYHGTDSLTFKVNDGVVDSMPATVSVTVTSVVDTAVFSPNGGERWARGTMHPITWEFPSSATSVKIQLYKSTTLVSTLTSGTVNTGSYNWTISTSLAAAATYRVKITSTANAAVTDTSDGNFAIFVSPTLSTVSPTSASTAGGTAITLSGAAFGTARGSGKVTFGGIEATSYTSWTDTKIVCVAPPHAAGLVNVSVINTVGDTVTKANALTYVVPPTLLAPNGGERFQRGASTTIRWSYPGNAGNVKLELYNGTTLASTITSGTANTGNRAWTVPTSLATGASYRMKITSTANAVATDWSDATFSIYIQPVLSSVSPTSASTAGGTAVTLTGAAFGAARGTGKVTFGGIEATSYTSWTDTKIVCIAPPHAAGLVSVAVINNAGDTATKTNALTYIVPPTLLAPNGGERFQRGASTTIRWSYLGYAGNVKVELYNGTILASTLTSGIANTGSYSWTVSTSLAAGAQYRIKVTSTANGAATDWSDGYFTIYIPPTLSTISPTSASTVGGTAVTLSGAALGASRGTGKVTFGGIEATSYTSWTDTKIVCVAPAHAAGPVTVAVTNNVGDTVTKTNALTYLAPPTVLAPNGGERFQRGATTTITWSYPGYTGNVKIELYNGSTLASAITSGTANIGSRPWTIPTSLAAGTAYRVKITSTANAVATDWSDGSFEIYIPPALSTVSPTTASAAGGTAVTLTGATFGTSRGAGQVTFGGVEATSYTSWTDTQIVCLSPAHAAGAVAVAVTNNAGDTATKANALTYITAPAILAPNGGERLLRGSSTSISWSYPGSTSTVKLELYNGTSLVSTLTSGAANSGSYPWTVSTSLAPATTYRLKITSTANTVATDWSDGYFTIYITPVISSVSPIMVSSAGGTVVTISGSGFGASRGAGRVTFGGVEASSYTGWSDTRITCVAPAHTMGPVDVAVTNGTGATATRVGGLLYQ